MSRRMFRSHGAFALLVSCVPGLIAQQTRGQTGALAGYTLLLPTNATETYLIDMEGEVAHRWTSDASGGAVYLLDDGSLLRGETPGDNQVFNAGGVGGRISRYAWDSAVLWRYRISDDRRCQHHDIEPLPNGNVLALCWELKTRNEVVAAGRRPEMIPEGGVWLEYVVELKPVGRDDAEVVWEWHLWDHLVQDLDSSKSNYAPVASNPTRVDFNFAARSRADWTHANGLDYNPILDQIVISVRVFSEVWVIDHARSTRDTAGRAGDLLYRWGNPRAYQQGTEDDRTLFLQHDAQWIEPGMPGAGNLLVFNNGQGRPDGNYSSIDEWVPPVRSDGTYSREPGAAFGPESATWTYSTGDEQFYASFISGTQRLANGNTLVCSGPQSWVFEVQRDGTVVWEYRNELIAGSDVTNRRRGGPPPTGMFRATRYAVSYPGLAALRRR